MPHGPRLTLLILAAAAACGGPARAARPERWTPPEGGALAESRVLAAIEARRDVFAREPGLAASLDPGAGPAAELGLLYRRGARFDEALARRGLERAEVDWIYARMGEAWQALVLEDAAAALDPEIARARAAVGDLEREEAAIDARARDPRRPMTAEARREATEAAEMARKAADTERQFLAFEREKALAGRDAARARDLDARIAALDRRIAEIEDGRANPDRPASEQERSSLRAAIELERGKKRKEVAAARADLRPLEEARAALEAVLADLRRRVPPGNVDLVRRLRAAAPERRAAPAAAPGAAR